MNNRPMSAEHSFRLRLLQAHRDGDPHAFTLLDRACRQQLMKRLRRKFRNSILNADCEDAGQIAMIKLACSATAFASDVALVKWLETCAYRHALNMLRRQRPQSNSPLIDAM